MLIIPISSNFFIFKQQLIEPISTKKKGKTLKASNLFECCCELGFTKLYNHQLNMSGPNFVEYIFKKYSELFQLLFLRVVLKH